MDAVGPCVDEDTAIEYLDRRLSEARLAQVEAHLPGCWACRTLLVELGRLRTHPSGPLDDDGPRPDDTPGAQFADRYTLLNLAGAGAMGRVWAAYDQQLDRRVAIKLLHDEGDDARGRGRLRREAKTLAQLAHPNVVTVYDVGQWRERAYVAMEFIDGSTLREWIEQTEPGIERLREVLRRAGRGLAAAHAVGVVHRDFKPENLLVAAGPDGQTIVKVTDFGLARRTLEPTTDNLGLGPANLSSADTATGHGTLAGTPLYMAPEQLAAQPATARSDQFAYCVTVFEALTGARPFAGSSLYQLSEAIAAGLAPQALKGVPAALRRSLERGLAFDADDRHASLDVLMDALDPRKPRSRAAVWLGGVVALGAIVATTSVVNDRGPSCDQGAALTAAVWNDTDQQHIREAFEATGMPYAVPSFRVTVEAADDYVRRWASAHDDACRDTHVHKVLSGQALDRRTTCLRSRLDEFEAVVSLLPKIDADGMANAVDAVGALSDIDDCKNIASLDAVDPVPKGVDPQAVAELRGQLARGWAQYRVRAPGLLDAARQATSDADALGHAPLQAEALELLGRAMSRAGDHRGAEETLHRALDIAERSRHDRVRASTQVALVSAVGSQPARAEAAQYLASSAEATIARIGGAPRLRAEGRLFLASVMIRSSRVDETIEILDEVLAEGRTTDLGASTIAQHRRLLGNALNAKGDLEPAEAQYRAALELLVATFGDEHPQVAETRHSLGGVLMQLDRLEQAEQEVAEATRVWAAVGGTQRREYAMGLYGLGILAYYRGNYQDAGAYQRQSLEVARNVFPEGSTETASALSALADLAMIDLDYDRAATLLTEAAEILARVLRPDHPKVGQTWDSLGRAYIGLGHYERAEAVLQRSRELLARELGPTHLELGGPLSALAELAFLQQQHDVALEYYREVLAITKASVGEDHPDLAFEYTGIGRSLIATGHPHDALAPLERALVLRSGEAINPVYRSETQVQLARALVDTGRDLPRALSLAEAARAYYLEAPQRNQAELAELVVLVADASRR